MVSGSHEFSNLCTEAKCINELISPNCPSLSLALICASKKKETLEILESPLIRIILTEQL